MRTSTVPAEAADEQQLRALLLEAPAAIGIFRGPELRIELLNEVAQQLLGHRDAVGRPLGEAAPELDAQGIVGIAMRVLETGEPFRSEELSARLMQEDGQPREASFSCVMLPIHADRGRVDGV